MKCALLAIFVATPGCYQAIGGVVRDAPTGAPVSGATVEVVSGANFISTERTTTGSDGRYKVERMVPGVAQEAEMTVSVSAPGYLSYSATITGRSDMNHDVELTPRPGRAPGRFDGPQPAGTKAASRYCSSCGSALDATARFCGSCGARAE